MVDTEDCLEQCEGTIADFIRLNDAKNEDRLKPFLKDYGRFKFSEISNLRFLITYTNFNITLGSKLKYVLISFATSTFDRIKKVNFIIKLFSQPHSKLKTIFTRHCALRRI